MIAIPPWARWTLLGLALAGAGYGLGRLHEARLGAAALADYKAKQGEQTVKIVQGQERVVVKTEIEYRDRIQKIYLKGETIEKETIKYVTAADDARCDVNVGFVRNYNAAWSGEVVGPAADADRESAGIPLSGVAEADAHNATSCLAWREQALGWRQFYRDQQSAINGAQK